MRAARSADLSTLSRPAFVTVWSSLSYLYPGLHPDGYQHARSGWPHSLRPVAREAWRRAGDGELCDEEIYPCDAQWAGLCDQMTELYPEEITRRRTLARRHGVPPHG